MVGTHEPAADLRDLSLPAVEVVEPDKTWVIGLYRVLVAISAWLLVGAHVLKPAFKIYGWRLEFFLAIPIIFFCTKVRGRKVFTRTPLDIVFVAWLGLAVLSQLWASMVLQRVLLDNDILGYLIIISTNWVMFRVAFAICCVDPRTATGAFIKAMLFFLAFACLIGILQGYGPGPTKAWATNFGVEYGAAGDLTGLQLDELSPRPVALFSGPNFFGFMNLIGIAIIMGVVLAEGRFMTIKTVWAAAVGIALFIFGSIVAQSRFAILTSLLLFCYFLYYMRKTGRNKIFLSGLIAIACVVAGGLYIVQKMDLGYLQSTFEQKLSDDDSFRERRRAIASLMEQAPALAPLGAGWNNQGYSMDRTGDVWSKTNSIDNAYLQAYINHGLPGVVHLLFFFFSCWWALRLSAKSTNLHVRTLRMVCAFLLVTYIVYSVSGVRHAKVETSVYLMIMFGLLYGAAYGEMAFHRVRAMASSRSLSLASA